MGLCASSTPHERCSFRHLLVFHCGRYQELCRIASAKIKYMDRFGYELDGNPRNLWVDDTQWFGAMADLLLGKPKLGARLPMASLASGNGWSAFRDTLWDKDPSHVTPGRIWLQRGAPYNNGSFAHFIVDGPNTSKAYSPASSKVAGSEQEVKSCSAIEVTPFQNSVALRDDTFILSRRYRFQDLPLVCDMGYQRLEEVRFLTKLSIMPPRSG